ncbi:MAG: hypothetical protein LBQ60_17565 [Bacteroidales bacterium]|jgi:hypothetical protein|nr:hypothetical protein [Bacteroidales bacterium]
MAKYILMGCFSLIRIVLFVFLLLWNYSLYGQANNSQKFKVEFSHKGPLIWNVADNMNMWDYSQTWHTEIEKEANDYFTRHLPFVRYIQLMTAAGGNEQRDLFVSPLDTTIKDDYYFFPLTRACGNILRQGLIPHIKLGNVPLKYTKKPEISSKFGVNKCPPYDYTLWHAYIKAMTQSLVDTFGIESVRTWRFGVITEYENKDWFSVENDPEKTRDAYFYLYDYTVDALEQILGKQVCVGAHSMTVSDGLWDERELVSHCARGKNRCTGKTGTRLCFLAASYYDIRPGVAAKRTLPETINILRTSAIKEGLDHLFYGIDEGRILSGTDGKPIGPRAVGFTWQAAYDARMYHTMLDENIDYFSHWDYTTNGVCSGIPSVSAQTAGLFYRMAGSIRLPVENPVVGASYEEKTGAIAAFNKEQDRLYLLFYAYSDSLSRKGTRDIECEVSGLVTKSRKVKSIRTLVSDDSNFFDEWVADWEKIGLTEKDFGWSSSSFVIKPPTLSGTSHLTAFRDKQSFYQSCAMLQPVDGILALENGSLKIRTTIPIHGVLLYEIHLY